VVQRAAGFVCFILSSDKVNISLFTQLRVAHFLSSSLYFKIFIEYYTTN
jgi:hypothetical protein